MITPQEYAARRQRFAEQLQPGSIAFLSAAPHPYRTYETEYPYRQDSDFFYLTGFSEPNAIAVITSEAEFTLFNQPFDALTATWTGALAGQEGAVRDVGADASFPIQEFDEKLAQLIVNRHSVYIAFNNHRELQTKILECLDQLQYRVRFGTTRPMGLMNLQEIVHAMRSVKSAAEIDIMNKAVDVSTEAHKFCMQSIKPNMYEYEIEAAFIYQAIKRGCRNNAYGNIVGGGANACTLHYTSNDSILRDGDLLLIDMGAELYNYASDLTRTYPVNGKFSPEQKILYEIVLNAQLSCIDMIKPGVTHQEVEDHAILSLTQGLVNIGLLEGDVATLIAEKKYRKFYMHRVGHWIGLDVHDRGHYFINNASRKLQPGMTMTVEPGLYVSPRTEGVDKKWWGIGIRIEDNIVVTEKGCRVLSAGLPKTVAEIESLMNE